MPVPPFFPKEEYQTRLLKVRKSMEALDLDGLLVSSPENMYYLSGINHWGFFAYHILVVPREGEMVMIARAMEKVTMALQLNNTRFVGYADGEDQAAVTVRVIQELGLQAGKLGVEKKAIYLLPCILENVQASLPGAAWVDASELVFQHRVTLSPNELDYTRQAAAVTDAMMSAAINAAAEGVTEQVIAAETMRAMVLAGGEYPAFGPFIRATPTLGQEHGTWTDRPLQRGDALFLEMSGSVGRYHAPMGRLVFVGEVPPGTKEIEKVCLDAFDAVVCTIRPGLQACNAYQAWQDVVDRASLSHYRRHHCGYMVTSAFPPAWSGPGVPVGLRYDSPMVLQEGMVFHLMSWLMGSGRGDYFVSNAAIITKDGCEVLTKLSQTLQIV
jgi:Xaa-Pro dipeptidase